MQAGTGDTRLLDASLLQLVQGFGEISKRLIISYIGTAEGRKGYLQSILIYIILFIHYIYPGRGTLTGDLYNINLLGCYALYLTLFMEWNGCDSHFLILNTHQTPMCVKKCGLGFIRVYLHPILIRYIIIIHITYVKIWKTSGLHSRSSGSDVRKQVFPNSFQIPGFGTG